MRTSIIGMAVCWSLLAAPGSRAEAGTAFEVRSADGVVIQGESDAPGPQPRMAMILVAGTGAFDRDVALGRSGTDRDLVFKDLARRLAARGVAAVRYDMRGVRYGVPAQQVPDRKLLAGRTTANMRDDLAAVYEWSRSPAGLGARCVGFFAHSEGMLHVARLAEQDTPAPALIIGMGAAMASPVATLHWQIAERDPHSLELMDANHDGVTTNDEVRANIARTPSGVYGQLEPFLHPSGAWKAEDIAEVRTAKAQIYQQAKTEVLAMPDNAPYPSPQAAFASYQWWKSWFTDERPAAELLTRWPSRIILHYGERDSQTPVSLQLAAATKSLPAERLLSVRHPERGHTLGEDVLLGPIDEAIADRIVEEAADMPCP
jgi:hypothetical protein